MSEVEWLKKKNLYTARHAIPVGSIQRDGRAKKCECGAQSKKWVFKKDISLSKPKALLIKGYTNPVVWK